MAKNESMTEERCARIHEMMMSEVDARFEVSRADRDELHRQNAAIFDELKRIRWGVISVSISLIGALVVTIISISSYGGFAKVTDLEGIKRVQAVQEAVSQANKELLEKINRKIP
jgi:ASC-1-like (ASCH) protein